MSLVALVLALVAWMAPRLSHADAKKDIEAKVKEAMENYDLFEYEEARKLLNTALTLAKKNKLEANPLVAWYASVFGPAVAFTAVKLFAIACGTVLYLMSRHRTVAALTLFYLAFAVAPWVHVFGLYSNV